MIKATIHLLQEYHDMNPMIWTMMIFVKVIHLQKEIHPLHDTEMLILLKANRYHQILLRGEEIQVHIMVKAIIEVAQAQEDCQVMISEMKSMLED